MITHEEIEAYKKRIAELETCINKQSQVIARQTKRITEQEELLLKVNPR